MNVVLKYRQYVLLFCHKTREWQTDRQTDPWMDRITTPKTVLALLHCAVERTKITHTWYWALGPELILVYTQSKRDVLSHLLQLLPIQSASPLHG